MFYLLFSTYCIQPSHILRKKKSEFEKETRTSEKEAEILKQKSELILILNYKFTTHTVFTCGSNHLPDLLAMNSSLKKQATDRF